MDKSGEIPAVFLNFYPNNCAEFHYLSSYAVKKSVRALSLFSKYRFSYIIALTPTVPEVITVGRKSVREDKNIYQLSRENAELTREQAAEQSGCISASVIEKIESEKKIPAPDEIMALAKCYKDPSLCNYYCTHDCEIGKTNVPEIKSKSLEQITLELLNDLNSLVNEKENMVKISVDGDVTEDEYADFERIHERLNHMSSAIDTLQLWIDTKIASGESNTSFEN